jgi:hypothetical protein
MLICHVLLQMAQSLYVPLILTVRQLEKRVLMRRSVTSNEVQIEAEITSEAEAGIGNLGVKVGSKIGTTRKVTSCFTVSTTIGENKLKGKCGEICVRTKLKKITLRKWKHTCYCDERGWWMVWAPTGVLKDYEIATGYCDDTSDLTDCPKL